MVSCGQSDEINAAETELNYQEMRELMRVTSNPNRFHEIKYYCEKTGGEFLPERPGCLCPEGSNFQGFGKPGCYEFEVRTLFLEGRNRHLTSSLNKGSFPVDVSSWNIIPLNMPSISLAAQLWKPYVHVPKLITFNDITENDIKKAMGFFLITDNIEELSTFSDVLNPIFIEHHSQPTIFPRLFEDKINFNDIKKHQSANFPIDILELEKLNNENWRIQYYHPRKCLVHCELSKEIKINNYIVEQKKIVRGGQIFNQHIEIRKANEYQNDFFIPIDFNNKINVIFELDHESIYNRIVKNVIASQNGKKRHFRWDLTHNLAKKEITYREEEDNQDWYSDNKKILLCDSDVQIENLSQHLKKKIYFSKRKNYLGHFNLFNKTEEMLLGNLQAVNINRNGVHHTFGEGHADSLLKFADDRSILPMSLYPCLHATKYWYRNAIQENVKVVNLSAADEVFDLQTCEEKEYTRNIRTYGKDFLWVMAAGNQDKEETKLKSSSCPQKALLEDKNVLIVSRRGRARGSEFVDIMISSNDNGYSQSSSESTIILSQKINELFNEFPDATPVMMKKAIIIGADFDRYQSYQSRSGGKFSYYDSKKILRKLMRDPNTSLEELVEEVTSYWGSTRKNKLKHLIEYYSHF